MVPAAWICSIQFEFWPPQLHQHHHKHSIYHLHSKLIHYLQICTGTNIHTCMTCTNYRIQATSTKNDLYTTTLLVYPLVTTRYLHCIELLPTPLPHTPHGHLAALCYMNILFSQNATKIKGFTHHLVSKVTRRLQQFSHPDNSMNLIRTYQQHLDILQFLLCSWNQKLEVKRPPNFGTTTKTNLNIFCTNHSYSEILVQNCQL